MSTLDKGWHQMAAMQNGLVIASDFLKQYLMPGIVFKVCKRIKMNRN